MIANLKPYPAYKDSGVPWLDEVPVHWEVRRLKRICCLAYGDALSSEDRAAGNTPVYGSNGQVGFHSFPNTNGQCLIIGRKGSFGKIAYSAEPVFAIDTTFFVDKRYTSANIRWLYYLLGWLELDAVSKDSAVPGLNRGDAYQYMGLYPSLPEQAAIVRYLDHMDQRIQRYLRAKQKLLSLLEEQKQAIIHQAVTGQVGVRTGQPYPTYKPSGVEWLGEVPAYWEVCRLKHAAALNPSRTEARTTLVPDTAVTFLPMERVGTDGRIDPQETLPASKAWNGFTYFRRDDVLVAKITPCFENGKGAHLHSLPTEIGFGSTEFHVLRAKSFLLPQFLYRLTTASEFRRLGTDAMTGAAGQQRVPSSFIANCAIPLPPLPDQTAIVAYLDKAITNIDNATVRVRRQIELLSEYRTRLIADVVTGKLDVREAAARLPDEAEVSKPFDESEEWSEPTDQDIDLPDTGH